MVGDTYFNANVTNEAICLGGNSGINILNLGWGFTAAHSRVGAGRGVGDPIPSEPISVTALH